MKNLIIVLMLCISLPIYSMPMHKKAEQYANEIRVDVENGRLAERTNNALDNMLAVAYRELKERGYNDFAENMKSEWIGKWYGFLLSRDIGDHPEVFSEWLDKVYKNLESLLGKEVLEFFHLDDIDIINKCIPIVFSCKAFGVGDYTDHMNGLLGSITYWGSLVSCMVLSSGILSFFCGGIGLVAEHIMVTSFSPFIAKRVYERFCSAEPVYYISGPTILWDN